MKFTASLLVVIALLTGCYPKNYPSGATVSIPKDNVPTSVTSTPPPFNPAVYNNSFYPTILDAAKGIAAPFLYQQGYYKLSGLTVNDSNITYNGNVYHVSQQYWNPAKDPAKAFHEYTIKADNYEKYNIGSYKIYGQKAALMHYMIVPHTLLMLL